MDQPVAGAALNCTAKPVEGQRAAETGLGRDILLEEGEAAESAQTFIEEDDVSNDCHSRVHHVGPVNELAAG